MKKKKDTIANLKILFLHFFAETRGNVLRSCELSGLARNTALRHYKSDSTFRAEWDRLGRRKPFDLNGTKKREYDNRSQTVTALQRQNGQTSINAESLPENPAPVVNAFASTAQTQNGTNQNLEKARTEPPKLSPMEELKQIAERIAAAESQENEIIYNDFGFMSCQEPELNSIQQYREDSLNKLRRNHW